MDKKEVADKEESKWSCKDWMKKNHTYIDKSHHHGGGGGAIYFFGFVGAAFYFCQNLTGMDFAVGLLKAIVWPAFLVYKIFTMLGI